MKRSLGTIAKTSAVLCLLLVVAGAAWAKGTTEAAKAAKPVEIWIYANTGTPQLASVPASDPADYKEIYDMILAKTGISVKTIIAPKNTAEAETKLNLLLAAGDQIDIFGAISDWRVYQTAGALQPLNDLLEKYGKNTKTSWLWPDAWRTMSTSDGTIWALPGTPPLNPYILYLRKDWTDKLGLKMPTNIDEYEAVLKAFKEKDPAGNGATIPLASGQRGQFYLGKIFSGGFTGVGYGNLGLTDWVDPSDGKLKPVELHPQFRDYVAKMADWYAKGYMQKEILSLSRDAHAELVMANKVGSSAVWYTRLTQGITNLKKNVPDANYVPLQDLTGPKGVMASVEDMSLAGTCIAKKSKNPEAAMKYIDFVKSDIVTYLTCCYGLEGKSWRFIDKNSTPIIWEKLPNERYIGEFQANPSFAWSIKFSTVATAPSAQLESAWVKQGLTKLDQLKKPSDYGVSAMYDKNKIMAICTNEGDIQRMRDEGIAKFILGQRPMAEYDQFVKELYGAGLDKWIEAYSAEYKRVTGK